MIRSVGITVCLCGGRGPSWPCVRSTDLRRVRRDGTAGTGTRRSSLDRDGNYHTGAGSFVSRRDDDPLPGVFEGPEARLAPTKEKGIHSDGRTCVAVELSDLTDTSSSTESDGRYSCALIFFAVIFIRGRYRLLSILSSSSLHPGQKHTPATQNHFGQLTLEDGEQTSYGRTWYEIPCTHSALFGEGAPDSTQDHHVWTCFGPHAGPMRRTF